MATDYLATSSGTWSNGATWTPAGVPGARDNIYIGGIYPSGVAASVAVTLTQSQFASNLFLGYDSGDSGTLNLGNYNLAVSGYVFLGPSAGATGGIQRGSGSFTAADLYVENTNHFTFGAGDSVSYVSLSGSSLLTTTATGNVTGSIDVESGSTLTMGANMLLNGYLNLQDSGSTLDMGGYTLAANQVYLGWNGSGPVTVAGPGPVATNYLYVGNGSQAALLAPTSGVNTRIELSDNSVLTLQQFGGQLTGLTLQGSSSGALIINDTSLLQLSGSNSGPSWIFRWQDPPGGSWVNTLTGSITAGQIAVFSTAGYSVFDLEGYTYIATPSTLIWNGGAPGNNNWSTAGNWGSTTPTAGHWLQFGPLTTGGHVANNNNLVANSLFYGIFFDSAAPSYNLQGNAIELSGDVLNQSANNQTIGLNIQFVPGDGAFDVGKFDTGGMKITDSGSISGAGMALTKIGSGTLILSGSNTYSGGTYVENGTLIVTNNEGLADGSNLTVGNATEFAPVVSDLAANNLAGSSVPEPGTLALFTTAVCSAAVYHRLRLRRKKP